MMMPTLLTFFQQHSVDYSTIWFLINRLYCANNGALSTSQVLGQHFQYFVLPI